jgi:RNA polymerase sigma-70 factor (ECF subfamily)
MQGARSVARLVLTTAPRSIALARPALVNGAASVLFGSLAAPRGGFPLTVVEGRIYALDLVADPAKLRHLQLDG